MTTVSRVELGCAGHFLCAADCHWRRHTQVGNYRISSIGDLYFNYEPKRRQTVGGGKSDFFETFVFKTMDDDADSNEGCGCRKVADWSEIEGIRASTAGEAQACHEKMVKKYLAMARKDLK